MIRLIKGELVKNKYNTKDMQTFGAFFLLLGPIIIILAGVIATVILASLWNGLKRMIVLVSGPALILAFILLSLYLVTEFINPVEGSGFLLGGATMGLYMVALFIYYPILLIWVLVRALVRYFKARRTSTVK